MRKSMHEYYNVISDVYRRITEDPKNEAAFQAAGKAIAEKLKNDELVYLAGPGGHSNMTTEECLCRAGMPVQLSPMIDVTNLIFGTTKTRFLQRSGKYAEGIMEQYDIKAGDVFILINAYGINFLSIDLVLKAKERGATVIGISSSEFGRLIPKDHPARHPSGANLEDIVDIFIDCKMPFGDAIIDIEGADQKAGPTSTLCNIFTINLLMLSAVEELIDMGVKPELWRSINLPNGDEFNKNYFHDYGQRIKYLL